MLVSLFKFIPTLNPRAKWLVPVWLAVIIVSLASATKIQVAYWKDGVTLFKHSLSVTGDCMTSVIALSAAYGRQDRIEEGMSFLDEKIAISKNTINRARLHTQYASLSLLDNQPVKALESLKKAIELGQIERRTYSLAVGAALASDNVLDAEKFYKLLNTTPNTGNTDFSYNTMNLEWKIRSLNKMIELKKRELKYKELDKALSDDGLW